MRTTYAITKMKTFTLLVLLCTTSLIISRENLFVCTCQIQFGIGDMFGVSSFIWIGVSNVSMHSANPMFQVPAHENDTASRRERKTCQMHTHTNIIAHMFAPNALHNRYTRHTPASLSPPCHRATQSKKQRRHHSAASIASANQHKEPLASAKKETTFLQKYVSRLASIRLFTMAAYSHRRFSHI